MNLLINFTVLAVVGQSSTLNFSSKDKVSNPGLIEFIFPNKQFLSAENRGHWTRKWISVSGGGAGWSDLSSGGGAWWQY